MIPESWPQETEDLLMDLVTWECLDNQAVDPKLCLRQLSLAELSVVHTNVENGSSETLSKFAVAKMINIELMYRLGKLKGDWTYLRLGKRINLRYTREMGEIVSGFHEVDVA